MKLRPLRLLRVELTVADLPRSEHFYMDALGFTLLRREDADPAMVRLLGADHIRQTVLQRHGQMLVLQAFQPQGSAYRPMPPPADQVFQHFAMPVADMRQAFARLAAFAPLPISSGGPQQLPERSGGVAAFKFRDPDGHPLELLQFPDGHVNGIDHSAIVVMDAERSIAFYCNQLGFQVASRQTNTGPEQDHLDGLANVEVDVVALSPEQSPPHLELLAYRAPPVRQRPLRRPCDIAATRLVLQVSGLSVEGHLLADGSHAAVMHDPDGHALTLIA